jgi:oligopeptidase B
MKDQTPGPQKRQEILDYLNAENEYFKKVQLEPTAELTETVYQEFVSRLQEDDVSVPIFKAPYYYYRRTVKGLNYPIYCRRFESMDATEEQYLDPNKIESEYVDVSEVAVSPNHKILAYSIDKSGDEVYTIIFQNLETGETLPKTVEKTGGSIVWDNKSESVFYNVLDDIHRSDKIYRHILDSSVADELVFFEKDLKFMVGIGKTNSRKYILLHTVSGLTSEAWYIDADEPGAPKIIEPRKENHKYYVEHQGDKFLIQTDGEKTFLNYKLQYAPVSNPGRENWKDYIPYDPYRKIEDVVPFESFIALFERSNGLCRLRIIENDKIDQTYLVPFDEEVFTTSDVGTSAQNYKSTKCLFSYSSFLTPNSTFEFDITNRERKLLKQMNVPGGFDPKKYTMKLEFCPIPPETLVDAPHNTPIPDKIPITVLYKTDLFKDDGTNPCLLYGYGSYGISIDPNFSSRIPSYLDRGIVYCIAHVRGGGENGRGWYETGKFKHKKNTFTDFVAASEYIVEKKLTSHDLICIEGRSAGGMLVGAVLNLKPDISYAAIAGVPFVDVINTMMDESIPLTINEVCLCLLPTSLIVG